MQIQKINLYTNNSYNIKQKKEQSSQNFSQITELCRMSCPIFKSKTIPKLYEEYNWYINHDRVPAIKSFLKIKETPEVMKKFFNEILSTKDRSIELLDSMIYEPREVNSIIGAIQAKIGNDNIPFIFDSTYQNAYNNFIDNKFKNEKSIISLLKIRPDWRGEKLVEKYKSLYGSEDVEIGNIPKELSQEHLKQIVRYLKNEMQFGYKMDKKIAPLEIGYRKYEFAYFTEGRSDKNVFGIFTPEGKKFVLKMGTPETRSFDTPFALGTLAKIDFYLTTHRSRNSAPLCYYNHKDNFSIYKYVEHIPVDEETKDLSKISKHLNDFKALGLSYNDSVGYKNFFKLDTGSMDGVADTEGFQDGLTNNEWISVDNDHVTYSNILQPLVTCYNTPLPNAMQFCC